MKAVGAKEGFCAGPVEGPRFPVAFVAKIIDRLFAKFDKGQ
jgi:hypothetical protein